MASYGLYSHIQSNGRRSVALMIGLFFLVYLMTYAGALLALALSADADLAWLIRRAWIDLGRALPVVTLATALWVVIAYYFHQFLIDAVTGAGNVTRAAQPRLYNLLENLCIARGIPMPKLKIMPSPALNAFATGMNEKQYAITVTSGLLDRLDDAETEAVLGHELSHIRNGDVRMLVIAVIIAGIVSFVAELIFRGLFHSGWRRGGSRDGGNGGKGKGGGGTAVIIALALVALAWFLSIVIRLALSRSREFLADAGSVELTKNPDAMITALRKIDGHGELVGATSAIMEMCFDNPRNEFADLFATHPSIESRVEALVKYAGGRDPGPIALPPPNAPPAVEGQAAGSGDVAPGPWSPAPDAATRAGHLLPPDGAPGEAGPNAVGPWGRQG